MDEKEEEGRGEYSGHHVKEKIEHCSDICYTKQGSQADQVILQASKSSTSLDAVKEEIDESKVLLRFHLIIPHDELQKCKEVTWRLLEEEMVMIHSPSYVEGIDVLFCEFHVPKECLAGQVILYTYTAKKTNYTSEHKIYLDCLNKFQDLSAWNIYNAYSYEDSFRSKARKFVSKFVPIKDSNLNLFSYYYELLPNNLSKISEGGKHFILNFLSVFTSMERTFDNFRKSDNLNKIFEYLKEFLNRKSNEDSLSRASCILYIFMECHLSCDDFTQQLYKCLSNILGDTNKCYGYEHFCKLFPDQWKRKMTDALLHFLKTTVTEKSFNPHWIMSLPFLHFLEGKSKPFQKLNVDEHHENDEWWGVSSVNVLVKICKKKISQITVPEKCMNNLAAMFEVDHLLPRSFLALMNLEKIPQLISSKRFPLDACLANVTFFVKNEAKSPTDQDLLMSCLKGIKSLVDGFFYDLEKETYSQETSTYIDYIVKLTYSLFDNVMQSSLKDEIKYFSIDMMIQTLLNAFHFGNVEEVPERKDYYSALSYQIIELITSRITWSRLSIFSSPSFEHIKIFSSLLELPILCLIEKQTLMKQIIVEQFIKLHFDGKCETFSKIMGNVSCHQSIKSWLCEDLVREVEGRMESKELNIIFEKETMHTFKDIHNAILQKIWPKDNNTSSILEFALKRSLFVKLLEVHRSSSLGDQSEMKLRQAISILENVKQSLFSGDIKMKLLNELSDNSAAFYRVLEKSCYMNKSDWLQTKNEIENIMKKSKSELQKYKKRRQQILILMKYCKDIHTDELNVMQQDITLEINDLKLSNISSLTTNNQSLLKIMQITPEVLKMLRYLEENQDSFVLKDLWDCYLKKSHLKYESTLTDVVNYVFHPCKERLESILITLQDGSIRLSDVPKKFLVLDDRDILKELNNFTKRTKILHEQIKNYKKCCECKKGAKVMLKFKNLFGLTGSFDDIKKIADDAERESLSLRDISDELLQECEDLQTFSEIQEKCLDVFIEEKQFVDWLRKSLSGPKEIKVLVDLALISAIGKGDLEVEKASCFHAATTAYSSLIYDLKPEMGFFEFISICKTVWDVAHIDKQIAKKFKDAARHLEWIKEVKESHGEVEVNVFNTALRFTLHGMFSVGNLCTTENSALTLENVVEAKLDLEKGREKMKLSKNLDENETWKVYDIKHLFDLQSKLMLVAGKAQEGKTGVEEFNRTLEAILRLANAYLKLVEKGCCMFTIWKITFLCDPTKKHFARIDFSSNTLNPEFILGTNKGAENLKMFEKIEAFCGVLENCLTKWDDYIQEKRQKNNFINFFTTKQLVLLQKEIAKTFREKNENIASELSQLLSLVQPSCTKQRLLLAATNARQQLLKSHNAKSGKNHVNTSSEEDSVSSFVKALQDCGFPLSLAKAAEENVASENIAKGISWCMANKNRFQQRQEQVEQNVETKEFFHDFLKGRIQDLTERLSFQNSLKIDFLEIWEMFLQKVDSGFADYISVELVGQILENLGSEFEGIRPRDFPHQIKEEKLSLVLSDQDDIWITILSLYANSIEIPLPSIDEVLVCNQNTSSEEIEIMCLRAKANKSGKLYCLARVELLDYNVARSVEKCLLSIEDTRFVVVCDRNAHSYIADILHKFKVKFTPLDVRDIQKYVHQHLTQNSTTILKDTEKYSAWLIKSDKAGAGKSLKVKRIVEQAKLKSGETPSFLTIPLQDKEVNLSSIVKRLKTFALENDGACKRFFHFDVSSEVLEGVDYFLFNLLILGSLNDENGYVWRKLCRDTYLIESCPISQMINIRSDQSAKESGNYIHKTFYLLPSLNCQSPTAEKIGTSSSLDLDNKEFKSRHFQRVCHYLNLQLNQPIIDLNMNMSVALLLRYCGVENPSWAELKHFIDFLNNQLVAYENSSFCKTFMERDLPDFRQFVIRFMLLMSQDFSTRSLNISEESPLTINTVNKNQNECKLLHGYQIKRKWEMSSHPYLFFNNDGHSFTFIGFVVDYQNGNIINPTNNKILMKGAISNALFEALHRNGVNLRENFDMLKRSDKLAKVATIMGLDVAHDPDETYELTADNIKKMLAIYMRFRCNIPVVIMGETGCGKTRLIKYLCDFMKPQSANIKNMYLMKIHGGTTIQNVVDKIKKVSALAKENSSKIPGINTILFFDEANTTSAIGVIKEAMCDHAVLGEAIDGVNLKLIAACNPYRKHSKELIDKMEKAGLGYHVKSSRTTDRLGPIPMRHLVYRVRSLPPSLLPLVWDFGQLSEDAEKLYIRQMVHCCILNELNLSSKALILKISNVLSASQIFMKRKNDECSFVSLRDVQRCLKIMVWFYKHDNIFAEMDDVLARKFDCTCNVKDCSDHDLINLSRSLILALGVCYHACLSKREEYRIFISPYLNSIITLKELPDAILKEISACQDVFLREVDLNENIARNEALKENVFVMVVCIELRIPLFLIGKPGSSKSLAKTVVADAMQGNQSKSKFFHGLKSAHMVSYQCSPLSTPEGISETFRQCAKLQEGKDLNKFVSVVVLDEVGLAEDSEKMPLKALHPLLEDGCEDEDDGLPHKKVAFIGISNWSLDPAKMNRGIYVQRCLPDENELILSARSICSEGTKLPYCDRLLSPLAKGYLKLYETTMEIKEFFGLRDFYSLIKIIYAVSKRCQHFPSWNDLQRAILRSFSGLETINAVEIFREFVRECYTPEELSLNCNLLTIHLIRENIGEINPHFENRYLLILMENYSSFNLLQNDLQQINDFVIIFGSSFPKDLEYTQVCRNINRIKICMETGKTVILLNLENLYESLYDALNQYYVTLGGNRFVDLGLGTHRVKCKVHQSFRLIVVADKQVVYKKFPIPLINRLEKHYLTINSLLTPEQVHITSDLMKWVEKFIKERNSCRKKALTPADVFIGFHPNALASTVLQAFSNLENEILKSKNNVLEYCQNLLLQCASPEAIYGLTSMAIDGKDIHQTYFEKQPHDNLENFLRTCIIEKNCINNIFAQITTHSRLLLKSEVEKMTKALGMTPESIETFSLQAFGTEQQFSSAIKQFFQSSVHHRKILIIQCDNGDRCGDLISCTRFNIQNEYTNWDAPADEKYLKNVLLIIQLPKVAGGCFVGFQSGKWLSYHIDNLQPDSNIMLLLPHMKDKSVSALFNIDEYEQVQNQKTNDLIVKALNKILENCIHALVASLKCPVDSDTFRSRKAKILAILVQNRCTDSNNMRLMDLLRVRMSQLLLQREESVSCEPATWLRKEAASLEAVCNAGSFTNSVLQCLEAKVTPMLAYVISYIDSNCNLDLLNTSDKWITDLWFEMLKDSKITFMKYDDIKIVKESRDMLQLDMKTFRQDGSLMKATLPFSWLIKDSLDKLLSQQQPHSEWMNVNSFDVEETFNSSDIGKLLLTFSQNDEVKHKIFDMYLIDYIQMTYRPVSPESCKEFEMVAKDVRHKIYLSDSSTAKLSKIHEAYNDHCTKYKLFSDIIDSCPETLNIECDSKDSMTIFMQKCLTNILNELSFPENSESVKRWALKVKGLTSVVNQIFQLLHLEDTKIEIKSLMHSWNRIMSLKLFVEHTSSDHLLGKQEYLCFWTTMGEMFDLKTWEHFENIETFLKTCDSNGLEKCFGPILVSQCCSCHNDGIILLSCHHKYCEDCYRELRAIHHNSCKMCGKIAQCVDISANITKESVDKYVNFKKQLNSFFMALVSKMCFDGKEPPEEVIITKLLEVIVSKPDVGKQIQSQISGYNDPNFIIRSFLLQLLLKHEMSLVEKHLQIFLQNAQSVLSQDVLQATELGILCMNCFEDHYTNVGAKTNGVKECLSFVRDLWKENKLINLKNGNYGIDINTFQHLALLKFGLTKLADGIHERYVNKNLDVHSSSLKSLSDLASIIFTKIDQARYFLMKQIAHKSSFHVLASLSERPDCNWFITHQDLNIKHEKISLDYFLICRSNYKNTRDCLFEAFYEKKPFLLNKVKDLTDYNLILALFQQMLHSPTIENVDVDLWNNYLSGKNILKSKDLARDILNRELKFVNTRSNPTYTEKNLLVLLFHFMVAIRFMTSKNNVIQLLSMPMDHPESLKDAYLPTMPQDDIFEAIDTLKTFEEIKYYKCSNNHLYTVGDCGMPTIQSKCPTCGEVIGGLNYKLAKGNTNIDVIHETTQSGHILGQPGEAKTPCGEREMTPLQVSITRFFLHASLYLGSFSPVFPSDFIKPQVHKDGVQEFFWNHMAHDFKTLINASGQNEDNILVALHAIVDAIYRKAIPNKPLNLSSKKGRLQWEKEFVNDYIMPYFDNIDEIIENGRKLILEDDGLVLSPLMKIIYEVDEDRDLPDRSLQNIHLCSVFWKFRPRISKEHLLLSLRNSSKISGTSTEDEHILLQHFLERSHILQEIRRLPVILDLQKKLCMALNRRISVIEAEKYTVNEFLKDQDEMVKSTLQDLFKEYFASWNTLKYNLKKFVFQQKVVPEEYLKEHLNYDSKIGFFLPTTKGLGICSLALIHYLVDQQNQLLSTYEIKTGQSITKVIPLKECTASHLILLDPEKELHTLILAHCNYNLEPGRSTKLEYDFANLEQQIMDQFIHDKPRIKPNITLINYTEDFNVCFVFAEIEKKIPQTTTVTMLENDFKILPDLSKVMPCFNVVLEFIASLGSDPNENIIHFMTETLKMRNIFADYPSMRNLQFKHAKQAWLSLSFIQTKMQVRNGQLPFWSVNDKYKKLMPDNIQQQLTKCLQFMRMDLFSSLLYECIIFVINLPNDDEFDNSNQSLCDILLEFIETRDQEMSIRAQLERKTFPREILACHCIDAWLCSVDPEKRILLL